MERTVPYGTVTEPMADGLASLFANIPYPPEILMLTGIYDWPEHRTSACAFRNPAKSARNTRPKRPTLNTFLKIIEL
jgi:hypothetical protein